MGKLKFLRCFKTDYRLWGIIIGEMNFYLPYEHILTNNFSNMINEYLICELFWVSLNSYGKFVGMCCQRKYI